MPATSRPRITRPRRGAAPPPELAKLSRPRLFRVAQRERLFRLLDERREHPIVWLSGPPGAGKTALVASYLEARNPPCIWFQVDAGDGDPATLFYYLGLAVEGIAPGKEPLPLFKAEYQRDLGGFTRRFFRALFARLPVGTCMVYDNFQDARVSPELRELLAEAMGEIPAGLNVIVLSRGDPLPEFARLQATQQLVRIGWDELRFTIEETAELLEREGGWDREAIEALHRRADGWVAGLILMREHLPRESAGFDAAEPEGVFDYFVGEIFNRIAPERQRVLLATAVAPRFTVEMAETLSGDPNAGKVLEHLYRRHLFLSRRGGADPVYEYHQLFRAFLLARARLGMTREAFAALARRAGELLEARGWTGSVAALYRDAADWPGLARVIVREAPLLLAQGRVQSICELIAMLPAGERDGDPWIRYWEGMALAAADPTAARECLRRAHDAFAAAGDVDGQLLSASAVIDSHYLAWDDFRPLDRWIAVMDALLAARPAFADPVLEARVIASLAIALVYRQPWHGSIPEVLARLDRLLEVDLDTNLRISLATRLMDGYTRVGSYRDSERVARRIREALRQEHVAPVHQAWSRLWLANSAYFAARFEEFETLLKEAQAIAETHGFAYLRTVVVTFRAYGWLACGGLREALPLLAEQRERVDPSRRLDVALCAFLQAWAALARGDLAGAEREARVAADLSLETGSVASGLICHGALVIALDATGQHAAAENELHRIRGLAADVPPGVLRFHALLFDAYLRLRRGEPGAEACLREAFAMGRGQGYRNGYMWWPPMMSALCAAALDAGIETDYVKTLITARGLAPPEGTAPAAWPWAVEIRALGPFTVLSGGAPLAFSGKAQKKPLELLKALVALGGRAVEWPRLAAILWPDAAGDAAKVSFDSTLYRLRKLLGSDAALPLQEGKLALDPRHCWVDVWAFERSVQAIDAASADAGGITEETASSLGRQVLELYAGHFLATEEEAPWSAALRDRLRAKLARAITLLGRRLEAAGAWRAAAALYARTLEHDNLAEDLYRRLMVCHRELGEVAEALRVYRRCRQLLSIVLNVAPSAETEAVRQSLQSGSAPADAPPQRTGG